jgi:hypothetical protein
METIRAIPGFLSILATLMIVFGVLSFLNWGTSDRDILHGAMVILSLLMIIGGYGIKRLRNWGRMMSLIGLIGMVIGLGIIQYIKTYSSSGGDIVWATSYTAGVIVFLGYPIYYLLKPEIASFFE